MSIPIIVSNTGAEIIGPIPTKVDVSDTITPAPCNPMNARKNPIPAPIASFKSKGMELRIAVLSPDTVIIKNIMLAKNTADNAACHELPIEIMIVYVNNAFIPIPGAKPTGYFDSNPIIIQATPEASDVEKNTAVAGIPP